MVTESAVLRMNIYAEKPAHRKHTDMCNIKAELNMRKSLFIILTILATNLFAQTSSDKSISYFENCIVNKINPIGADNFKFETDSRLIVWSDPLTKSYKYSNEEFDKLGYEFVKKTDGDKNQYSKIYRNCKKGIVVEVTTWLNNKFSISFQWFPSNLRTQIAYMTDCDFNIQEYMASHNSCTYSSNSWIDIVGVGNGDWEKASDKPINQYCEISVSDPKDSTLIVNIGGTKTAYKMMAYNEYVVSGTMANLYKTYYLKLNNESYTLDVHYDKEYHEFRLWFYKNVNGKDVDLWLINEAKCPMCTFKKE